MKIKIRNIDNSCYKLVIDQPGVEPKDKPVLAKITHFFASGSWAIEDVRLAKHHKPDPWFSIGADRYQAHLDTDNEQESELIRSLLTEFQEKPNDQGDQGGVEFSWCTYDGLVRGRPGREVSKFDIELVNNYPLFHSRKDALSHLKEIAEFWEAFPCDASDPDVIKKTASVKIDNPFRQMTDSQASAELFMLKEGIKPKSPRPY